MDIVVEDWARRGFKHSTAEMLPINVRITHHDTLLIQSLPQLPVVNRVPTSPGSFSLKLGDHL